MENNPNKKVSRGRQKVEMVKMSNESNLQVTFSKRRSGLFKKASELCTLCGAEMVIVVFSPGRKVFSFGHPSVEAVLDRFINRNQPVSRTMNTGTMQLIEAHRNANVRELNQQLTQVLGQLDAEKKRGEELKRLRKTSQAQCWWEAPMESLDQRQLEQLKTSLEELKRTVTQQADRILIQTTTSNTLLPPNFNNNNTTVPYFGGTSSSSTGQGGLTVNNIPFENHNDPKKINNVNYNVGFGTPSTTVINGHAMNLQLPATASAPVNHHVYNNNVGYGRGFF